ncbi:SDR family oxidoreductase [Streptomyces sp. UNOC14_S4]|uniref:SDR family NAD(P)-dependent oxidoreductase n=1 Tax=Streptomyces sp. UNOC14_S4 TaxID=2872340 RepID=UPI001E492636|nr:SDR family NAD(P)-dependent oxidoreductase [Streptomyces sp. UNOC14_S4]MCC3766194.1 SDR family NAD(P)-dependent oxidoreductase [Streptomyces sp. UNOC14_S4]
MATALVTGATAGLGKALARALAHEGADLVLVARTRTALEETARQLRAEGAGQVAVLPADLASDTGCDAVTACLTDPEAPVDLLVNNAGMGYASSFPANTVADEEHLLDVNVRATLRLTHAALGAMIPRRSGAVVNVASVAGLGPAWLASTYPASKAWVINFTESLARSRQVRESGVRLMALLPGYTRTEFHQRAGISTASPPQWLWLDADRVARTALRHLRRGAVLSVPSLRYKTAAWGLRHLPRTLTRPFAWEAAPR